MLQMSRQFSNVAENCTPAASCGELSEQELPILLPLASGKNSPEIPRAYKTAFKPGTTTFTTSTRSYALTIAWKR